MLNQRKRLAYLYINQHYAGDMIFTHREKQRHMIKSFAVGSVAALTSGTARNQPCLLINADDISAGPCWRHHIALYRAVPLLLYFCMTRRLSLSSSSIVLSAGS